MSLSENDELMMESYRQIRVLFEKVDKAGHGMLSRSDFNVRLPMQKEMLWQKTHPKEEIIVR